MITVFCKINFKKVVIEKNSSCSNNNINGNELTQL